MKRERVVLLGILVLATGAILFLRLVQLQILGADDWRAEAEMLTARERTIPFRRGSILDRNGQPIAFDEETHSIDFDYRTFRLKNPLAQATQVLLVLDAVAPDGSAPETTLASVARRPKECAARIAALSPARIAEVEPPAERQALRLAIERLLGFDRDDDRTLRNQLRDSIRSRSPKPLRDLFPNYAADATTRIGQAASDLARLDGFLGKPEGTTVERLERERQDVLADVEASLAHRQEGDDANIHDVSDERADRLRQRESWLVRLESDVPYAAAEWVSAHGDRFAGFLTTETMARRYVEDILPSIVGTVRPRNADELRRAREDEAQLSALARKLDRSEAEQRLYERLRARAGEANYPPGDLCGSEGVEKNWESDLHGARGRIFEMVGRRGSNADRVEIEKPKNGIDVTMTIDLDLQRAVEEALRQGLPALGRSPLRGAVVVIDVWTGDVLAIAATPDYAREDLKDKDRFASLMAIDADPRNPNHPLHHRGYRPWLPPVPGSCFKIVTALAALEKGLITPATIHRCEGRIGTLKCDGVHGDVNLDEAIEASCNVYFGWVGEKLGLKALRDASERFGFGMSTGFDPMEVRGGFEVTHADAELLRRCGVGYQIAATPLHVARAFAALANGGKLVKLRSVRKVGDREVPPEVLWDLGYPKDQIELVRESLRKVVSGSRGTARESGLAGFGVAGKTGTAEMDSKLDLNHAWFAGYAPFDNPRIAFAAYAEKAPIHGKDMAPVLKRIFESEAIAPYLASH